MTLTPIEATKIDYICVKWFHLMRRVHIRCFCTFKVHEKIDTSSDLFKFLKLFFRFLYAIDEFITVLTVFYRCFGSKNGLKNRFLGKKNFNSDFPTTIMAEI
jgi:hypothetical protein